MMTLSRWKVILVTLAALLGVLFSLPNMLPSNVRDQLPAFMPKKTLNLGLDLQGGSYLLYSVNTEALRTERLTNLVEDVRSTLRENEIAFTDLAVVGDAISVRITDPGQVSDAANFLRRTVGAPLAGAAGGRDVAVSSGADQRLRVAFVPAAFEAETARAVEQSIEIIRRRIDQMGTKEPDIARQGKDRIVIQAAGESDPDRLKNVIGQTAKLTFQMVDDTTTPEDIQAGRVPPGSEILQSTDGFAPSYIVKKRSVVTGEMLTNAQPGFDQQTSRSVVSFQFDTRGAITFGEITSKNVGKRFAIVLDDRVITAPTIQQPITGGSGQITGNFTPQSANDLAVLLRAGALPATLDVAEERSVGPSLGADSIHAGVLAGVVAGILVVTFMVVAYGLFGFFADISLVLNIVLIIGSLSLLGSTLTLPGIAGIVLTIGMSVDANVLIYERIREELKAGKSILAAIDAGFKRAWGTIIDSHLTQLIAAVVLYFLGSGPVQGFAVTLALGILTSLFTSYTVTLYFVGAWYRWRRPKTLKIQVFRFIPDGTKIPFMKISRYAIIFSVVISLLAIGSAFTKGFNLGIDFIGGSAIELQKTGAGDADPAKIREDLKGLGLGDIQVQQFGTPKDVLVRVQTQPGGDAEQQVAVTKVTKALESDQYTIRRVETVGPQVSGELTSKGVIAVIVALFAILIYVWFRFEWQFALAAITTTSHDVIMTIGLFSVFGLEFNISSIAAVLTLVGLSLNETVVISDRVRENLRKYKKMSLPELIDLSINQTIVRTSLTQFTILLALFPLVFFGGESIRGFTIAMTFGSIFGMYSSVFIGGPILIYFGLKARNEGATDSKAAKIPKRADGAAV